MTQQELIDKLKKDCKDSKNEEEVRLSTNIFLENISKLFDIKFNKASEISSLQGGRADSIYSNIIFEYKTINKFKNQKGIDEAFYGRNDKDRGLYDYLINFSLDASVKADDKYFAKVINSKVGVGFDGSKFIFCRFKKSNNQINIFNEKKTVKFPRNISKKHNLEFEVEVIDDIDLGIKKLLLFIRSTERKFLSAENLSLSFSGSSDNAKRDIKYLYELLEDNLEINQRISTLYKEWNRIFGDIYGKHETDFTEYKDELIEMYSLPNDLEIRKCLFILQTYYSLVTKLLIHNLLESLSNPTKKSRKIQYRNELTELFSGDSHIKYSIDNFFEIHFFEWFVLARDLDMDFINDIINELDTYETTSSIIKPEIVSDVLKKVYSSFIPKGLRHLLGEYYTPDWLVDFTIEKSNFDYGIDSTALDPTCGSGAFITHLIRAFREKHKNDYSPTELIKKITNNIVGFDINPIAVISAKANYILSLGDISELSDEISIPIYMCDSILVPTVHAKQQEKKHSIDIDTVVGKFEIPVFENREKTDYFLKTMSSCILKDYTTFNEFHELIKKENRIIIKDEQIELSKAFYDKLHCLHLDGSNGFWPIILKNSFAPLFSHDKFDVLVGNPPWITWKAMSDTYRKLTLDIWLSYGIFEKSAYDKITTHDDFAMAVTYVSIDHYLKKNGITAFVLPQTFVKSLKGGEGFRKFEITRDNLKINFAVNEVYDMVQISPFKGEATNRTSVYVFEKNKKMEYPMDNYFICENIDKKNQISFYDSYEEVKSKLKLEKLSAQPINSDLRSPWLTVEKSLQVNLEKYLGKSSYRARKGIEPCGAKGIYLVNINEERNNYIEIENLIERSRLQKAKKLGVRVGLVEKDLIYPMVGGRNFDKWGINSYLYIVLPHKNEGKSIYRD